MCIFITLYHVQCTYSDVNLMPYVYMETFFNIIKPSRVSLHLARQKVQLIEPKNG